MDPNQSPAEDPAPVTTPDDGAGFEADDEAGRLQGVRDAVRAGALFQLDSDLANGLLDELPVLDRMAVALLQFDFATILGLLPDIPDEGVQAAVAAAMLLPPEDGPPPPEPGAALDPETQDGHALVLLLASYIETSLPRVLNQELPAAFSDDLHRYVYCRLLMHIHPSVAGAPETLFVTVDMSEAQMFCATAYFIQRGQHRYAELTLNPLHRRYRASGHLFYLHHRLYESRNVVALAKAWLLNAWTCPGIDERLAERVHCLFGIGEVPDRNPDRGLRALQGAGQATAFVLRRGGASLGPRPDSPLGTGCLDHAAEDLDQDIQDILNALRAAPLRWDPAGMAAPPDRAGPGGDKVILVVTPPKAPVDLGLALSAASDAMPFWVDILGRLVANLPKLEPARTDPPDLAMLHRHADFLRAAWMQTETANPGLNEETVRVHVIVDPRDVPAIRVLWPGARYILCVPDHGVARDLAAAGLPLDAFTEIRAWRRLSDLVRVLAACGVPRTRRRALLGEGDRWRRLFYPA